MNFLPLRRLLLPLGAMVLVVVAFRSAGWPGVAAAGGALVMWLLLHFTRLMAVMRKAADRPVGYVDSAVMLNAKLRSSVALLHVLALTRALGEALTPPDAQPERFRWTDASGSHVTCEFRNGRLVEWWLVRPPEEGESPPGSP